MPHLNSVRLNGFLRHHKFNGVKPDTRNVYQVSTHQLVSEVLVKIGMPRLPAHTYKEHCERYKHLFLETYPPKGMEICMPSCEPAAKVLPQNERLIKAHEWNELQMLNTPKEFFMV